MNKATLPTPAPVRRTNLSALIVDQLRDYVFTHGLLAGDRLPPERELASHLQVSRPTLRTALKWLSARGALRRVQGGGTYLRPGFMTALAESALDAPPTTGALEQALEARLHIEPVVARLAAQRATPDTLAPLAASLDRVRGRLEDHQAWHEHDLDFHLRVVRLAGNEVLGGAVEPLVTRMIGLWIQAPGCFDPEVCLDEHTQLFEALEQRDGDAAARLMHAHLRAFVRAVDERAAMPRPLEPVRSDELLPSGNGEISPPPELAASR